MKTKTSRQKKKSIVLAEVYKKSETTQIIFEKSKYLNLQFILPSQQVHSKGKE
jgi:hypothetical protein